MKRILITSLLLGSVTFLFSQKVIKTAENLKIMLDGKMVLTYVHSETLPPEGVDPIFKRSAYIHPLTSPGGQVLTRIQPEDHYHHYGIWNPWTRTRIGDTGVDFWNIGDGQGTVRFAEYQGTYEEEGMAGFRAKHEHIYFLPDGTEKVAINEIWMVTVQPAGSDAYVVDLEITLNSPLKEGILLEAYRYGGGLGYRATENWNTDNSTVLTSSGKSRQDADASKARWVLVEGESSVPQGRSGILFMSFPENRAHPEPMRMWPPDQYEGKSNVFFEFCPIRHEEWKLQGDKDYTLKYRMLVFDGILTAGLAETWWKDYAGAGRK